MLKDADPRRFAGVYVVCGFTDLRYGIDSLSAIIERRFQKQLFVPNTLFLFCGKSASKIKGLLWEGDGFLLLYKVFSSFIRGSNAAALYGRGIHRNFANYPRNSSGG